MYAIGLALEASFCASVLVLASIGHHLGKFGDEHNDNNLLGIGYFDLIAHDNDCKGRVIVTMMEIVCCVNIDSTQSSSFCFIAATYWTTSHHEHWYTLNLSVFALADFSVDGGQHTMCKH